MKYYIIAVMERPLRKRERQRRPIEFWVDLGMGLAEVSEHANILAGTRTMAKAERQLQKLLADGTITRGEVWVVDTEPK